MKNLLIITTLILLTIAGSGCLRRVVIRSEVSGTWKIDKVEISHYTNQILDSTQVFENCGTIVMDVGEDVTKGNPFSGDFTPELLPIQLNPIAFNVARVIELWQADTYDRDRITFMKPGEFTYTRIEKGKHEQWMFIEIDNGLNIARKEMIYLTRVKG